MRATNWIHDKNPELSVNDKLIQLIKIGYKLVLVQFHELERIRNASNKERYKEYVDGLYEHYIVLGKPKMYLP